MKNSLQDIDPYDIPPDLARQIVEERLPEFQPPETIWERLQDWGSGRADDIIAIIGIGALLVLLPSTGWLSDQLAELGIGVDIVDFVGVPLIVIALFSPWLLGGCA